jgi:hypothetical protein
LENWLKGLEGAISLYITPQLLFQARLRTLDVDRIHACSHCGCKNNANGKSFTYACTLAEIFCANNESL